MSNIITAWLESLPLIKRRVVVFSNAININFKFDHPCELMMIKFIGNSKYKLFGFETNICSKYT